MKIKNLQTVKSLFLRFALPVFAISTLIGLSACDKRTPAEKIGDGLEEAAEGVEDAVTGD